MQGGEGGEQEREAVEEEEKRQSDSLSEQLFS